MEMRLGRIAASVSDGGASHNWMLVPFREWVLKGPGTVWPRSGRPPYVKKGMLRLSDGLMVSSWRRSEFENFGQQTTKQKERKAMFCEWTGNRVKLYDDNRCLRRQYSVRYPVRSVQVTGEGNDARVAISMENGHTSLYQGDGRLIRA